MSALRRRRGSKGVGRVGTGTEIEVIRGGQRNPTEVWSQP